VKEALFAAAIESEETIPLSETYEPSEIAIASTYNGPHPSGGDSCFENGEMDQEDALFQPGILPMEFVMVSRKYDVDRK
jgi:hypothetical protein